MTTWGCTPLCRGFDRHGGFYNADEDYFSHLVGKYIDLRLDFEPDTNSSVNNVYSTDLFAQRAIDWITEAVGAGATNSFGYLAFQAIHGPQQAPADLVESGFCAESIPASDPVRRVACAQMRSVDANVAKVVSAYKALGIWDRTLILLTADNGGNTDTGGSNWPLRGAKATMYEGGMRAAAFVSGAGLEAVAGTVNHEFYSLVDWLPTIAGGIAGVDLAEASLPKYPYQPAPPPLDGINVWESLSTGSPSPRTSALLYLDPFNCFVGAPSVACTIPGQGAYREGNYKVISGHVGTYQSATTNVSTQFCGAHDGDVPSLLPPLNVTKQTSPPFCPAGWVRPPGSPGDAVVPPPEEAGGACSSTPCRLPSSSPLLTGGVFLFDVVNDPLEQNEISAQFPEITARLLAALQAFNATNIPQAQSGIDPASSPSNFKNVWTPWRGDAVPSHCDPNTTAPTTVDSNFDGVTFHADGSASLVGWCWSKDAADGGRAALNVSFSINGNVVGQQVANVDRGPQFLNKTGAPNSQHGFLFMAPLPIAKNMSTGSQVVHVLVAAPDGSVFDARKSPVCLYDGNPVKCRPID